MDLLVWFPSAAVTALAVVLWTLGKRVLSKLDELDALMRTELRAMDVRITRIEATLWPEKR